MVSKRKSHGLDSTSAPTKSNATLDHAGSEKCGISRNDTLALCKPIAIRLTFIVSVVGIALWCSGRSEELITFVKQQEVVIKRAQTVPCSKDYDLTLYKGCAPKRCGRVVMDGLVTSKEAEHLVELVESALSYGGSTGGASILDLHSGAMSKGNGFVNIYSYLKKKKLDQIFTDDDFLLYTQIKNRIRQAIATEFGILQENLYLTKPTFFSRMTNATAKTIHDEYWHVHVDKETYGSFFYTSLLYLTNHNIDYTGGRFIFNDADANRTVEPRTGRVSFFTSGSENPHFVEKVTSGTRYAVTVSFTCDKDQAIRDPTSEAFQD